MALNLCKAIKSRWKRNCASLSSVQTEVILWPRSFKNCTADSLLLLLLLFSITHTTMRTQIKITRWMAKISQQQTEYLSRESRESERKKKKRLPGPRDSCSKLRFQANIRTTTLFTADNVLTNSHPCNGLMLPIRAYLWADQETGGIATTVALQGSQPNDLNIRFVGIVNLHARFPPICELHPRVKSDEIDKTVSVADGATSDPPFPCFGVRLSIDAP